MMMLAASEGHGGLRIIISSVVMFLMIAAAMYIGFRPLLEFIRRRERFYGEILHGKLLMNVNPRLATILTAVVMTTLALIGYALTGSLIGFFAGVLGGLLLPGAVLKYLHARRLARLEDELVGGIQTLASGVRAGLNLVQSMQMLARDGPIPINQEFGHLCREYEYGMPLEEAMNKAAERIGSGDFRLLFAALQTHRERGGDLGETLDRIAASIREIQRLENRVKALTAQGRATARWLGMMPLAVLLILYFLVDSQGTALLFTDPMGKLLLLVVVVLNIAGFLWIKKVVAIDI